MGNTGPESAGIFPPPQARAIPDPQAEVERLAAGREYAMLLPDERLAVAVARSHLQRAENPGIDVTAALVLIIDRLTGHTREEAGGGPKPA